MSTPLVSMTVASVKGPEIKLKFKALYDPVTQACPIFTIRALSALGAEGPLATVDDVQFESAESRAAFVDECLEFMEVPASKKSVSVTVRVRNAAWIAPLSKGDECESTAYAESSDRLAVAISPDRQRVVAGYDSGIVSEHTVVEKKGRLEATDAGGFFLLRLRSVGYLGDGSVLAIGANEACQFRDGAIVARMAVAESAVAVAAVGVSEVVAGLENGKLWRWTPGQPPRVEVGLSGEGGEGDQIIAVATGSAGVIAATRGEVVVNGVKLAPEHGEVTCVAAGPGEVFTFGTDGGELVVVDGRGAKVARHLDTVTCEPSMKEPTRLSDGSVACALSYRSDLDELVTFTPTGHHVATPPAGPASAPVLAHVDSGVLKCLDPRGRARRVALSPAARQAASNGRRPVLTRDGSGVAVGLDGSVKGVELLSLTGGPTVTWALEGSGFFESGVPIGPDGVLVRCGNAGAVILSPRGATPVSPSRYPDTEEASPPRLHRMAPVASTGEALVWFEHRPGTHDAMGRWVEELVLSRLSAEGTFGPALAVVADGRSTEWFGASDDGATNVLCSRGKERYTAEVRRGGETFSFEYERNGRVNALSPDGSRLLVEESDDCALYDTTNGRVVARIPSDIRWAAFDGAQRLCYQTYIDGDESEKMVVCLVDPDGTSNELTDLPPSRTIPDDVARLVRDASGEGTIAFSRSGARKVKVDGTLAPVSASGVAGWSGDLVVAGGWTVSVERRKL